MLAAQGKPGHDEAKNALIGSASQDQGQADGYPPPFGRRALRRTAALFDRLLVIELKREPVLRVWPALISNRKKQNERSRIG
jgi:hypothetical protein